MPCSTCKALWKMENKAKQHRISSTIQALVPGFAALVGALACTSPDVETSARLVRLDEVASLALPEGSVVRAVIADGSENMLVVTDNVPLLLINRAGRQRHLRTTVGKNFLGARFSTCDSCIRVLVSQGPAFAEVNANSGVVESTVDYPGDWEGEWMNAVAFRQGWVVGGRTSGGRLLVYLLQPSHSPQLLTELSANQSGPVGRTSTLEQAFRLSVIRDRIVASLIGYPHLSFVIDSGGRVERVLDPAYDATSFKGAKDSATVSIGVVGLGSGYLQVLADLTSDRRTLVLFDSLGVLTRARQLDAPWGPAEVIEKESLLVAIRAFKPPELALYRWTW